MSADGPRMTAQLPSASPDPSILERSFLAGLPDSTRAMLLAGALVLEVALGQIIFQDPARPRVGIVLDGISRSYLLTSEGKQLTVRYARPGSPIGALSALVGDPSPLVDQAVTDCSVLELDHDRLTELIHSDADVSAAVLGAVSHTLRDTYSTLASVAFGSMRERIARHLLGLGAEAPEGGPMVATVTQQQLATSLGTAREVVARTLRDLKAEGLIETRPGKVVILDPAALTGMIGRWRMASLPR